MTSLYFEVIDFDDDFLSHGGADDELLRPNSVWDDEDLDAGGSWINVFASDDEGDSPENREFCQVLFDTMQCFVMVELVPCGLMIFEALVEHVYYLSREYEHHDMA